MRTEPLHMSHEVPAAARITIKPWEASFTKRAVLHDVEDDRRNDEHMNDGRDHGAHDERGHCQIAAIHSCGGATHRPCGWAREPPVATVYSKYPHEDSRSRAD